MANYKVVISGYYGFRNAGDEAMLYAILRSLRSSFPSAEVTVISGRPEETAEHFHTKAVARFDGLAIFRSLWQCDVLISGGGSLLQDVTSSRSLLYYLSIIFMGIFLRKRVFLYSQGIGPLRRKWVCSLLAKVLSHADIITVRDEKSRRLLLDLGVRAPVFLTADAVLSLPQVPLEEGQRILEEAGISLKKKTVGISVRNWIDAETWIDQFGEYVSLLQKKDINIVFIPMQCPEDRTMAQQICKDRTQGIFYLDRSFTAPELMSIIGNLDLLVGMRLHALIFAALMHVPFIGISYDPKIDNFLHSIGEEAIFPVSAFQPEKLYNKTEELIGAERNCFDWKAIDKLRKTAEKTMQLLEGLVTK